MIKRPLEFIIKHPADFEFYNQSGKIKTIQIGIEKCMIGYKLYEKQTKHEFDNIGRQVKPHTTKKRFYDERKLIDFYVKLYRKVDKLSKENMMKILQI